MQANRHRRPAHDIALLFTVTNGCACEKAKYHTNTINKDIHYFVCANNKVDYRGSCPGRHYVRADAIEQVVMLELRRMAEYLSDDEDAFAELLARKTDKELLKEQKRCEEELQKAMARNDTVSRLYEKLYEDNAIGKVSDEWFMQLSHTPVYSLNLLQKGGQRICLIAVVSISVGVAGVVVTNSCASVKRKPTPLGAKFGMVIISRSMRLSYGLFENTVISVLLVK